MTSTHAPKVVASSVGHSIAYGSVQLTLECDCGWTRDLDTETGFYDLVAVVRAHLTVTLDDDHPDLDHLDPVIECAEDCMATSGERQQAGAR